MSLPFTLVLGSHCKIIQSRSNMRVMIMLSLTMRENSRLADKGSFVCKYRMYKLQESLTNVSTKIRIPPHLFASILNTLQMVIVEELGVHTIVHPLDGDKPTESTPIVRPSLCPFFDPFLYALNLLLLPSQTLHFHLSISSYSSFYAR